MPESGSSYTCSRGEDFTLSLRDQEQAKEKLLKHCLLIKKQKKEIDVCSLMLCGKNLDKILYSSGCCFMSSIGTEVCTLSNQGQCRVSKDTILRGV